MYGVIDIGSNTIRLVVYSVKGRNIQKMVNKKYAVGLVGYIDDNNVMTAEGIEKLVSTLTKLKVLVQSIRLDSLYVFATASLRNIANTEEAVRAAKDAVGWDIEILSGADEARFGFYGMLQEFPFDSGIVVDIGGGSTEITFFADGRIVQSDSLPIGSLNLYQHHVSKILPSSKEVKAIREEIDTHLSAVSRPAGVPKAVLCMEGGSARAARNLLNERYMDAASGRDYDAKLLERIVEDYDADKRTLGHAILKNDPERIHTLIPGILVMNRIVRQFKCRDVVTVSGGVREGYLVHRLRTDGAGVGASGSAAEGTA